MCHFSSEKGIRSGVCRITTNIYNNLFRPATADSRFQFWKTWLVEQIEADEKEPQDVKEKKAQRKYQNEVAFKVNTVLQCKF